MNISRRAALTAALAAGGTMVASPALARPRRLGGMELREHFYTMPDGPAPNTSASGQSMIDFPGGGAAEPWIRNGFMSARYPQQFEGGCYRIARLANPVTEVGATFALTPALVGGGLLCLSIQMGNIAETSPSVPVSPMHFWVDPWGWNMDVNTEAGTQVDHVASGSFSAPLVADGSTIYGMGVLLDRANALCHLWLPDGQFITLADPRFNRGGRYVYVEPFKTPGDSGAKSAALVREWWANS